MAHECDTFYLHRTQILDLLSARGLTRPRIPRGDADGEYEIIVSVASTTSLLDIAGAERDLRALLGFDVDIGPERSERGGAKSRRRRRLYDPAARSRDRTVPTEPA